ncbi:hypothetical protein CHARACLAT_032103, partial [Characodon lateralis]|nr:hypothetical protein [Characodon lateralis]
RRHEDAETVREVNTEGKEEDFTAERGREGVRGTGIREGAFELPVAVRIFRLLCTRSPPPSPFSDVSPHCKTQTLTHTLSQHPADGPFYTHQPQGPALKTSQTHAHRALHGANFNSQLCKSSYLELLLIQADAIFIFHTFPSSGSVWILL